MMSARGDEGVKFHDYNVFVGLVVETKVQISISMLCF